MRWLTIMMIVSVPVGIFVAQTLAQKTDNVEVFMRAKLDHSQKVLEGLTTEDFQLIAKNAQDMSLLSEATMWQVLQTPDYNRRSSEFRHSAGKLKEAAKDKNLDGATLAFVDLTIKCVECHKYVRSVRHARLENLEPPVFDATALGSLTPTSLLFGNTEQVQR